MNSPHRRFNPLTGEWVLVSPHRAQRPWQGQRETPAADVKPRYDPACYLCPGNVRANGERNPSYERTFVFTNDFAALMPVSGDAVLPWSSLLRAETVRGECRVICFSPRHDLTLAEMAPVEIRQVVDAWAEQIEDLGSRYAWVQIFENKGAAMGASNPHPHGQVWASNFIPTLVTREDEGQREHFARSGRPLLLDVVEEEIAKEERTLVVTDYWVLFVPFWAVWPFEYLLVPRRPVTRLTELSDAERDNLAVVLREGLRRYDALFDVSFPYSMGWHGAPTTPGDHRHWQLHAHYYPPLLRSATVRKFMVGYEMLAESQRDILPEDAAARLRTMTSG